MGPEGEQRSYVNESLAKQVLMLGVVCIAPWGRQLRDCILEDKMSFGKTRLQIDKRQANRGQMVGVSSSDLFGPQVFLCCSMCTSPALHFASESSGRALNNASGSTYGMLYLAGVGMSTWDKCSAGCKVEADMLGATALLVCGCHERLLCLT